MPLKRFRSKRHVLSNLKLKVASKTFVYDGTIKFLEFAINKAENDEEINNVVWCVSAQIGELDLLPSNALARIKPSNI